jgi:hypothetical protein
MSTEKNNEDLVFETYEELNGMLRRMRDLSDIIAGSVGQHLKPRGRHEGIIGLQICRIAEGIACAEHIVVSRWSKDTAERVAKREYGLRETRKGPLKSES